VTQFAIDAAARFQWEESSKPSQAENCGPTCVARIVGYYKNSTPGIEAMRRTINGKGPYNVNGQIVYGAPGRMPTNAYQQRDMLIAQGIPASVRQISTVAELHALVDSGRRPVLIGILMALLPNSVSGHPFDGWHAVVVLGKATVNGVNGFWVNDPNFSPKGGIRPDPKMGRRFYSDAVMRTAYTNNQPASAVVPTVAKPLAAPPPPTNPNDRVIHSLMVSQGSPWIRATPGGALRGQATKGMRLVARRLRNNSVTYADYRPPYRLRRDWLEVEYEGGRAWTAKAFWKTERAL
jgi:hypothetical protein